MIPIITARRSISFLVSRSPLVTQVSALPFRVRADPIRCYTTAAVPFPDHRLLHTLSK